MLFRETQLAGVFLIEPERRADERGHFARTWCRDEFARHGLETELAQCSVSFNRQRGTFRGMHWQQAPWEEAKLVRCGSGAIHDIVLDLRVDSPSYGRWQAFELTADNQHAVFIPRGVAHGFLTRCDNSEVYYQISTAYHPEASCGLRWDDPAFDIRLPDAIQVIAERDRTFPDYHEVEAHVARR